MIFQFNATTSTITELQFDTVVTAGYETKLWHIPSVQRGASSDYVGSKQHVTLGHPDALTVLKAEITGVMPEERKGGAVYGAHREIVGWCSLVLTDPKNRDGVLSVLVDPKRRECLRDMLTFLVQHAFREHGLHRVSATRYDGDDGVAAVYKDCGFTEEGRRRRANWVDGAWRDEILLGVLEEEWAGREPHEQPQ
ncbi:hypothetical protein BKA93DRAFT_827836 [Sparassis latifolia]|uniref:Acyl-CoA N-acyltransferase n=1 Tax=Sparassis crispa TaxID=139825 RepID=A0A401GSL6_9APHY|nr:hypothetical protein SCP_0703920 [Sparassis crispa]GBE85206.1 hypothetical protein SCP_0703920 [Sparassis crispa]